MPEQSVSSQPWLENRWTDNHESQALICFRTDPDSHPLSSVGLVKLNVSDSSEPLAQFNIIAQEDPAPFFGIDFSVPAKKVETTIRQLQSNDSDSSTVKDSETMRRKIKPLFEDTDFLETLIDHLDGDHIEEFGEFLVKSLREEAFSDPTAVFEIYVAGYKETEPEDKTEPEQEETSDRFLSVQPEINPSDGTPLVNLDPDDIFKVRIVGQDVKQLKSRYQDVVDGPNSKSIPLSAELKDLQPGEDSFLTFIVDLGKQLLGKGQTSPESRVDHLNPKQSKSEPIDYLGLTIMAVIGSLLSLAILILLFPGMLYALFAGSGGL